MSGGYDGSVYLESAERYDPRERFWVWLPSMSSKRGCYTLTVFGDTLYDMGRALLAIYLNVPWDPGGTDGHNIQAIAWGHAMFRGGGIVTPDTIRYMGLVVSDFRLCCFGLQAPSSSYKGEKQQIEKNKKNIPEQRRGQGSRALSDYGDHLCWGMAASFPLVASEVILHPSNLRPGSV